MLISIYYTNKKNSSPEVLLDGAGELQIPSWNEKFQLLVLLRGCDCILRMLLLLPPAKAGIWIQTTRKQRKIIVGRPI
jgi:hypothetical protein